MRPILLMLVRFLPWITRYFVVSNVEVDRIEPGLATLIRKKWWSCSYLYLHGAMEGEIGIERISDTPCFWGPWLPINMTTSAPVVRQIDELESFVMIRRYAAARKDIE